MIDGVEIETPNRRLDGEQRSPHGLLSIRIGIYSVVQANHDGSDRRCLA